MTRIVNVGYKSANIYAVGEPPRRLLVDAGWPGTLGRFLSVLRRMDVPVHELAACLVTHYHPDHAGLAQELRNLGVELLLMENQPAGLEALRRIVKPADGWLPVDLRGLAPLAFGASRARLGRLGISGEIIAAPGHSPDSIALLTDDGDAFIGDLPPALGEGQPGWDLVAASWQALRAHGARMIYPAHGPAYPF